MPRYKVIIYFSDGTSEEPDKIFNDISMAETLGETRLKSYKSGYKPSPGGHTLEDGCTARYEIIEI